jgi:hypothetical protein
MNENAANQSGPGPMSAGGQRQLFGRLRRLVLKELREILRDFY